MAQLHVHQQNNDNMNSSLLSGGSNSSKRQKFRVFRQAEIKRENSLDNELKLGKFEDMPFMKSKNIQSATSIKGYQTPRKVPTTPRKQLYIDTSRLPKMEKPNLKNMTELLKQILRQIQKLLEDLKKQYYKTMNSIMADIGIKIKQFLKSKDYTSPLQNIVVHSTPLRQIKAFDEEQIARLNTEQQKIIQQMISKNQVIKAESINESADSDKVKANLIGIQRETNTTGRGSFSNMIKLRQDIRKDAATAVPKKYEKIVDNLPFQNNNQKARRYNHINLTTQTLKSNQVSKRSKQKREITTSIQKLRTRLSSLKHLLNQQ